MREFAVLCVCVLTIGAMQGAQQQMRWNRAMAKLEPKSGSKITGTAVFSEQNGWVTMTLEIQGAEPGVHAVHIHEKGDCMSMDAMSAGGHWNPSSKKHGKWGKGEFHLGDIGNVRVGADGRGRLRLRTKLWTIGGKLSKDVVGHALMVHAKPDDFTTQPTGGAGDRLACGEILRESR